MEESIFLQLLQLRFREFSCPSSCQAPKEDEEHTLNRNLSGIYAPHALVYHVELLPHQEAFKLATAVGIRYSNGNAI